MFKGIEVPLHRLRSLLSSTSWQELQVSKSATSSPVKHGRLNLKELRAEIQKTKNPSKAEKRNMAAGVNNMNVEELRADISILKSKEDMEVIMSNEKHSRSLNVPLSSSGEATEVIAAFKGTRNHLEAHAMADIKSGNMFMNSFHLGSSG